MQTNVQIDSKALRSSPEHIKGGPYSQKTLEELVASTPSERNWRGIFIALLVIIAVLGMIVFSIVLVSPPEDGPRVRGQRPHLRDLIAIDATLQRPFNGTWISDTELVFRDADGGITVLYAENMTTRTLMTNATFREINAVDFKVSSDLKYVLLISDVTTVFTYSKLARYTVYEIATRHKFPLSPKEDDSETPFLQYAVWSPDGKAVAFVHDNDIYYKPRVQKALVCRITNNGTPGIEFNGVPDWLYENEILKQEYALWFSNDGQYLLYLSFNDTLVEDYKYPWFGGFDNQELIYPEIRSVRYPKVGTINPNVTVWAVHLNRPKYLFPFELKPTNSVEPDSYVTSVNWFNEHNIAVVWLNRQQNKSVLALCRSPHFNCSDIHTERPENGAWVHTTRHPAFSANGDAILLLPVRDGEHGNFHHLCHIDAARIKQVRPLTHGRFDVIDILGWDTNNNVIYAIATPEGLPGQRHLYKIGDTNSTAQWPQWLCMTCPDLNLTITNETDDTDVMFNNTRCLFNNIIFSPDFSYYIQECLGPDVPTTFLVETENNTKLVVLDTMPLLRKKLKNMAKPQIKNFEVFIEDGYKAQVRLFLPPGVREEDEIVFPLVLLINGEPESQSITEKFQTGWAWYLSANKSFIVAQIDGRGSGFQGDRMRHEIHHRLGSVDAQDQLTILKYLRMSLSSIDPKRICIAGKGYGGYLTATVLALDTDNIINCSVSLAPMTVWEYHNSWFTERYQGTSKSDMHHSDLGQKACNLVGRRFMLAHGLADTTVHAQHSMAFAAQLIKHGTIFTHLTYPDIDHSFKGVQQHLYKQIDTFLEDSFDPLNLNDWDKETDFFIFDK